jgi:HlyD family secretion protein
MVKNPGILFLVVAVGFGAAFWIGRYTQVSVPVKSPDQGLSTLRTPSTVVSVSGLGTLEPVGEVHVLAGPMTQLGGAPRIKSINVAEGDTVQRNQILVTFDNLPQLTAERVRMTANIESKKTEIKILKIQTDRFEQLAQTGSFPIAELEERRVRLAGFHSQLQELMGTLKTLNERLLSDTVIRAPIDGIVLRTNARVGERAQENGVLEIGNTSKMQALIQVDEGDISSIRIGQPVTIKSENGAFGSILNGKVGSIGLEVTSKKNLGRDPILDPDLDKRVINIRVDLDPESSQKTRRLTGAKVIGIIKVS